MLGNYLRVRIQHVAECPEVDPLLCAEQEIPDHLHDQQIDWFRLDPTVNVGLGKGWQVFGEVPVDLRVTRVAYYTLDGAPFDPPYDDIHHRDETRAGLVDGAVGVRRFGGVGPWVVGGGLGVTLPIGKTEEDPFALTELGLTHQHQQFGSGTFVPTGSVEIVYADARWGALAWGAGRLPLYESGKGYRPPGTLTVGGGPTYRPVVPLQVLVSAELVVEGPEWWSGTPYGGRTALVPGVGVIWGVSDAVVAQVQARVTAWQDSREDTAGEGSLVQPVILTLGVSWSPRSREASAR